MKILIIGAGISALYLGQKLKENNINFDIYEKNNRIGGRVKTENFDNINIIAGAGIGRYTKDKLLYTLCKKYKVKTKLYTTKINYTFKHINILNTIKKLKKYVKNYNRSNITFSQFAKHILGNLEYKKFLSSCGYTDFLKADIIDTIEDYGFDDIISGMKAFSINWNELLENLYNKLKKNIFLNKKISNIKNIENNKFIVKNKEYDKIVFATDNYDFDFLKKYRIYKNIKCQSFTRLYVKLDKNIGSGMIFTEKPFQKIIQIDNEKHIYMISYSDNIIADKWKKIKDIKKEVRKGIEKIFDIKVKVLKHKLIYWKCGTHYFKPLKQFKNRDEFLNVAQNPEKNVFVIGEGLSKNQGWCEGALESVEKIYKKIIEE